MKPRPNPLACLWDIIRYDSLRPLLLWQSLVKLMWGLGVLYVGGGPFLPVLGPIASLIPWRVWGVLFVCAALGEIVGLCYDQRATEWASLTLGMFLWAAATVQFDVADIHWSLRVGSFGLLCLGQVVLLLRLASETSRGQGL